MGDRCYLQVIVANSDVPKFMGIVQGRESWSSMTESEHYTEFEDYEANYAMYDELEAAAKEGCLFFGYHGRGDDYGSGEFFGADCTYSERECGQDGGYVVRVRDDNLVPEDTADLLQFLRQRRIVKQRVANPLYDLVRDSE